MPAISAWVNFRKAVAPNEGFVKGVPRPPAVPTDAVWLFQAIHVLYGTKKREIGPKTGLNFGLFHMILTG